MSGRRDAFESLTSVGNMVWVGWQAAALTDRVAQRGHAKFSRIPSMAKGGGSASRPNRGAKRGRGSSNHARGGRGGRPIPSTQDADDRRPDSAVDEEDGEEETASDSGSESGEDTPGEQIHAHVLTSSFTSCQMLVLTCPWQCGCVPSGRTTHIWLVLSFEHRTLTTVTLGGVQANDSRD